MYKSFYNLTKKPFQISSDPAFLWFGEKHKEALATLKYGILDNKGFLLLTGDVGTGKTSLINALIQSLSDDIVCTSVPDPGLEKLDFFNYIAAAFGMDKEFSTKGTFLAHFRKFLLKANENNKKVLLIIDEAQLLTQEMLEEIRLLSNIEKTDAKLINIFFIGQNEFNEILNREQNRAVRQRLTLNYNIDPLTPDETCEYIKHRLNVAGATGSIFDESAMREVFIYSGGFPRRINVICDHSLLSGYVKEKKIINADIVKECAKELKIPSHIKNRDINGFANYQETLAPVGKPKVYQSQPREIEKNKKKGGFQLFLSVVICLLLVLPAWFYLFPDHYKDSVARINKNVVALKYNIVQIIPEPYSSFFKNKSGYEEKVKQDTTDVQKKENQLIQNNEDKTKEKKTDDGKTGDGVILIEKIQPIQEEIVKEDGIKHRIQPQSEVDLKKRTRKEESGKQQDAADIETDLVSMETSQDSALEDVKNIETKKEILPLPEEKIIIRFKYNTNDFTDEGYNNLIKFADILATHPEIKILISGFTDSEGNQKYNQKLSEFRANIVGGFFLGKGILPHQIQIEGLGSQHPVEKNDTAWGRMMNRRVEIEILKESN
ncbi:MAG: AAA family ATPase [Proteobacteria bacterium]|nr:AAA family ATPase [Pseudomonadota bacterium]MBU1583754.1 AAA family ATPase [Pseudomonadota bacterium]MBU2453707.1 AAA family ATPase [Pseudomonadota bacterium]MBU2629617.1 AAA family ATPase [Pseudomonadota bacterium]